MQLNELEQKIFDVLLFLDTSSEPKEVKEKKILEIIFFIRNNPEKIQEFRTLIDVLDQQADRIELQKKKFQEIEEKKNVIKLLSWIEILNRFK